MQQTLHHADSDNFIPQQDGLSTGSGDAHLSWVRVFSRSFYDMS
jgi:hypothetical protein